MLPVCLMCLTISLEFNPNFLLRIKFPLQLMSFLGVNYVLILLRC
jgi:hypothetical protein